MKQMFKPLRILSSLALLMWATGCATTQTSHVDMLTEAGFKLVNADTPKKQELLKTLPAGHLSLISWKGKSFYVQPAATPNQAYVGTAKEYETYQGLRLAKQMRNDDLMAAQMNHTAMTQWNAWGPSFYGGFYGPYRY